MTFQEMLNTQSMTAELIARLTGHSVAYINKRRGVKEYASYTMEVTCLKTVFTFVDTQDALANYLACGRLGYDATLNGCVVTIYHKG